MSLLFSQRLTFASPAPMGQDTGNPPDEDFMDVIRTSVRIGKTIRNVSRLKEIILIFAKNGLAEFISMEVTNKIPNFVLPRSSKGLKAQMEGKKDKDWSRLIGQRLRKIFEELGPTFIKLGQLLSTREDLFEQSFIHEMQKLRDNVTPVPFEEVEKVIEKAIGIPINEVFQHIDRNPIGTASIGVVFRGTMKNGQDVVVKVRRPNIEKMIEVDFSIMKLLVAQAEKLSDDIKFLGITRILNDFSVRLQSELNFNIEALNGKRFKEVLEKYDEGKDFVIPNIYEEYTQEDVLIMDFMPGLSLNNESVLERKRNEIKPVFAQGLRFFMKSLLSDGFFHADLHAGNFFLQEDNKLGIIDFGLMGTLSKKGRKSFVAIVYSLLTFNYENLVYEFLDVAEYEGIPDTNALILEVRDILNPYIGLTTQKIDHDLLLQQILRLLRNHQIYLPREWFIVFKALTTLDGIGRSLKIDFDLYSMMEEDIQEIIKDNLSKDEMLEDAFWVAKDVLASIRILPRHMKWFLREWSKNKYTLEIGLKGHSQGLEHIAKSISFLGHSLLSCIFVVCGTITLPNDSAHTLANIPSLSWIFWALGATALVRGLFIQR